MAFKKAVKTESKIRLALAGPSGSGKTYTALTLGTYLADGGSVAVIDTERGSASKYADLFQFDVMELETYHPNAFIAGIHEAEQAGYTVIIIDSLTHAWNGPGGILEIVDQTTRKSPSKNSFSAWSEATPLQNALIDAITRSSCHVIVTMRSKTEYVIETGSNGRSAPRKVGMSPVQRADVEYEFDIYGELTVENDLIIQKSRCSALSGQVISKPGEPVAKVLLDWLAGAPVDENGKKINNMLKDFRALFEGWCSKTLDWREKTLRQALDIEEGEPLPEMYTPDDVNLMALFVENKRQAQAKKAS